MATEDFTTYDESDDNGRIVAIAGTVTVTDMAQTDDCHYLSDDKGVNHFSDFTHLVTVECTDVDGAQWTWRKLVVWELSSATQDDLAATIAASDDLLLVYFWSRNYGDPVYLYLESYNNGVSEGSDSYTAALDTPYYLTIQKSGDTVTCKIYSDSDRTNLLDTLTLSGITDNSYRYIYATQSEHGAAGGTQISGLISNLDLQEGAGGISVPVAMHQTGHIISKIIRG